MKIVVIGAAPTGLGAAYRLNELKQTHPEETADVELCILEQASL
jgi:protoporphyrinogen oxidase